MSTTFKVAVAAFLGGGVLTAMFFVWREPPQEPADDTLLVDERLSELEAQIEALAKSRSRVEELPPPIRQVDPDIRSMAARLDALEASSKAASQQLLEMRTAFEDTLPAVASGNPREAIRSTILDVEQDAKAVDEAHFAWTPWHVFNTLGRPTRTKTDGDLNEVLIWLYEDPALQKTLVISFWYGVFASMEVTRE